MTTDNLKIWDTFSDIDPAFTKPITGKPYKGTSPNPHYVIRCLTEIFGPVGVGFGWSVVAEDIERFGDTAIHWCRIEFWHTDRTNTFQAYGQTKMAYMTSGANGYMMVDEDAPKKSLTDAITKAAAQVGVGANIFLGRWDDSKYVAEVAAEYREKNAPPPDHDAIAARLKAAIEKQADVTSLDAMWAHKATVAAVGDLPEAMQADVQKAYADRQADLFVPGANE